jgi:hypothetical protein
VLTTSPGRLVMKLCRSNVNICTFFIVMSLTEAVIVERLRSVKSHSLIDSVQASHKKHSVLSETKETGHFNWKNFKEEMSYVDLRGN